MAAPKTLPDRLLVYELLAYEPEAEPFQFSWHHRDRRHFRSEARRRAWNGRHAAKPAGHIRPDGYLRISLGGVHYLGHRLAWLLVYGSPVPDELDHINGNPSDNRIENLRKATRAENLFNAKIRTDNKLRIKGIHYSTRDLKYVAQIWNRGKCVSLGYFDAIEEAIEARRNAAERLHGDFVRHG